MPRTSPFTCGGPASAMWVVLIQSLAVSLPRANVLPWHFSEVGRLDSSCLADELGYVEVTQVLVNDRFVIFNCTVSELWDSF